MRVGRARRRRGANGRIVNDDDVYTERVYLGWSERIIPLFSFFWLFGLDGESVLVLQIPAFLFVSVPPLRYMRGFDIDEQARIQDLLMSLRTSG